jgi:hypothetical protein
MKTLILLAVTSAADAEFKVNIHTLDNQEFPSVANDAQGNFVVVWRSEHEGSCGIYGRRFRPDGILVNDEFKISVTSVEGRTHYGPSIAMNDFGYFTVAWPDHAMLVKDWKKQKPLAGDITGDSVTDIEDMHALVFHWLNNYTIGDE